MAGSNMAGSDRRAWGILCLSVVRMMYEGLDKAQQAQNHAHITASTCNQSQQVMQVRGLAPWAMIVRGWAMIVRGWAIIVRGWAMIVPPMRCTQHKVIRYAG